MRSLLWLTGVALQLACVPPSAPVLCLSSVDAGAQVDCTAQTPQLDSVELTAGTPVFVQHVLPDLVDPYGNELQLTFQTTGFEETRSVAYGKTSGPGAASYRASMVFELPDAGSCVLVVHAAMLNSATTVVGHVAPCP